MLLLSSASIFYNNFLKNINSFRKTNRVSYCFDPDQDRGSVSPDLDTNCVQRLSGDDKSLLADKE